MGTKYSINDKLSLKDELRNNELFRNSNISGLDFDDPEINLIKLKKGEILFRQGDPANSIYLIIEGEINLIKQQAFGKIQSLLSKNNFFGHDEYFCQSDRNSIAIAFKDSLIAELSKENIDFIMSRDSSILENVKATIPELDKANISDFESAIEELPECSGKLLSLLPMELLTNREKLSPDSTEESSIKNKLYMPESNMTVYNKIDLDKIESGINKIIHNINENLMQFEEEKNKIRAAVSEYENDNKILHDEIDLLKEQESKYINLDKEKNEILGRQSYRIIEIEKEIVKFKEGELEYSEKIKLLLKQNSEDKVSLKKLETYLKEKDKVIYKLDTDIQKVKKELLDSDETRLKLIKEYDEQRRIINNQKAELNKSEVKVEKLSKELFEKEKILTGLNKELLNKDKLISEQTENVKKGTVEIEKLKSNLNTKSEIFQNLSAKLSDLQSQLNNQKENEKNKNEYILNQSHKISEYEEQLKLAKEELSQKDETANNFIKDIGELSENVWQKQAEINEQNKIIIELNDELSALKKFSEDFINKENDFNEKIFDLKSQLYKVNNSLKSLSEDVKEKSSQLEMKEKENLKVNSRVSDIQKSHNDLNNTLEIRNKKINDLENVIARLKNELSESQNLKEEVKSFKADLISKKNVFDELKNENGILSEKIKNLELQIEENKKESKNSLLNVNDELNKSQSEIEKYKDDIREKDKIIKEQTEQFENLKSVKSSVIKVLTSTKSNFEEEIKKKDDQIAKLKSKLENLQKTLDEKNILETKQAESIENHAQRITELEVLVNESKVKNNNQVIVKEESILKDDSPNTDSEEQVQLNEDEEIFSKSKLIASESANSFMQDNSFEHFLYSDIHIVNINLTRATMDVTPIFNKFLQEIINNAGNKIIVNLSECEYIDSSILGVLVSSLKKTIALDGELKIVWRDQNEYSMFSLTKMDKIFQIFPTLKDALNSYS